MKKIVVVGMGPGSMGGMTEDAKAVISAADEVVGYKTYIDLLREQFPSARFYDTGMRQEEDRCRYALEAADSGKLIALVCSGDSSVYGMAALLIEVAEASKEFSGVEIEIVPGVTAALSGSAVLGAPLTNDFAVISLSNLLTPLSLIEKRLRAAASGDFCIALYNPRSHGRPDALKNACSVLLEQVKPDTVCGWVRNIARSGEEFHFCTLKELMSAELDMFCTAFVGNSLTRLVEHSGRTYMVTPRGYGLKTESGR